MDAPTTERFDLARFLPYRLTVLAARISRRLAAVYGARFGLDVAEWRVIAHLAEEARVSVREVHARVDLEKPRVSRAVARLALRGLVAKVPAAGDRRLVELSLTPAGRRMHGEIVPLALEFEARVLGALESSEREALMRAIGKLDAAIDGGSGRR